jgi:peptidyl-prolyl cis-trans isomerase C
MLQKTPPSRFLPALGLALLLGGWIACKPAPEQEETAAAPSESGTSGQAGAAATGQAAGTQAAGQAPPAGNTPLAVSDLPAVVATVNGHPIKKEILLQGAQVVQVRLAQAGRPPTTSAAFYRTVLNELITITLLQQDAKAQGITADEQEVQRRIDARKRAFPSEDAYQKALAQSGISEEVLRQQSRDQLSVQKYVETRLAPNVTVSDQEAREFYEKNKAQIHPPERLRARHILVRADQKASPADKQKARQKAESLIERLRAGEDFEKLARENSDDPGSRPQGGDLGWIVRGQTVPPFDQAAFALTKPNELSPVVESPFGFHLIQLVERQQPETPPYEQIKDDIMAMLKNQQTQRQVEKRGRELRAKSKVEVFI